MLKPLRTLLPVLALVLLLPGASWANNTAQTLPFSQNWTNIGLITANDDWSGVPGIEGFRGDGLAGSTAVNPQTILVSDTPGVIDVNANQTNPNTFATGGATEFHIADPVVALTGSGTARAPYLKLYLNTTGQSGITISYNLRDIDGSADNSVQPVALHFRVGNTGTFTDVPAGFVADASSGPSLATLVTPVCAVLPAAANNQPLVEVRVMTSDAVGNDEWIGVDDIVVNTAGCGVGLPNLSISDVTLAEGDPPGTTTFTFAVTLSAPAGPGGVTFNIATADGTAQDDNPPTEDNDYVAQSLTGQSISTGSTGPYNFSVTVNRDTTSEPNETFFVNVTSVTGANVLDGQGQGTINNDDVTIIPIHDIQGPGGSSPLSGSVTTRGIVTGVKTNGFFIQEPDASVDADPATSEGIFVFTSSAPPPAAALGNQVQVTGTIAEFVPAADLLQPPLTELTGPTVVLLSSGNPLPAAIPLTATFPDPAGPFDQLERLEGMRVSVASLTVSGPTLGNGVNEANATQTSNGVFFGTVTGVPRPRREPGIQAPDPAPSGSIPPIPRFDSNPELLRVDSDGLVGGGLLNVGTGAVVTGLIGPLDYTFRRYTILPDPPPAPQPVAVGGPTATAATVPTGREFTVASYNLERFFDTVNDPGIGEPVLTPSAFDNRLNKASLGIRNHLQTPDILGVVEVENLTTLQALAARINADAVAAAQPDPQYTAHLVEGNDIGGIDVGFLVKTAPVAGSTPRVTVNAVVQENAGEVLVNPDSSTDLLNDRPSLRLDAVINHPNGASFPVTVIVNHLRSLNDVNSIEPGSSGWTTAGERVRAKRKAQADSLANLVQVRQTGNPAERIILVGDFNAYEFNDGLVDSMNILHGTPPPDNQTAVPGDGVDLVNPDLDNLFDTPPPAEQYSYIFDGQIQNIDHVVVNAALTTATVSRRIEHPRINADFPAVDRNDPNTPRHLSDHDPVVGFFEVAGFATADLSITKVEGADPVTAGTNLTYTITVTNGGPDAAVNASWSDTLPAGTTFVSLPAVAGWSCTTGATVSCSNPLFAPGSAVFTLTVAVDPGVAAGTVLSNTATVTSATADPDSGDTSATETTTVATSADLSVTKTDSPDPVTAGTNLTYTITVTNAGPSNAASVSLSDTLPAGTTFVSLPAVAGWSCTTGATVTCTNPSFAPGSAVFTLTVAVDPGVAAGTVLSNTATVSSATPDPETGNESATATTDVQATSADLSATKTDTPDPVTAGTNLTYTVTVTNAGPDPAVNASWSDTLPAGTTFVSVVPPGGWTCPSPGAVVTCTNPSFAPGSAVFTLTVTVDPSVAAGSEITNLASASSDTADPDPKNQVGVATTTVEASADLSVTKTDSPDPVSAGANLTYTITVTNAGPSSAASVSWSDTLPAGTTFVSVSPVAGWSCATGATVTCTNPSFAPGSAVFTLTVAVGATVDHGTVLSNTATVTSSTTDPNPGGESASADTTVANGAVISATKAAGGQFFPGGTVTYTVVLTNSSIHAQSDNPGDEFTDVLPAELTLVSATASSGTAVATTATDTVTWNGSIPGNGSVTITIQATVNPGIAEGTTISNQGNVAYDSDGDGTNDAAAMTDGAPGGGADPTIFIVGTQSVVEIPTLNEVGLALLVLLLAIGGTGLLRRRARS